MLKLSFTTAAILLCAGISWSAEAPELLSGSAVENAIPLAAQEPAEAAVPIEIQPGADADSGSAAEPAHRGLKNTAPVRRETYRSRRAVIVGINYSGIDRNNVPLAELKNAELDAQQVHQLLTTYYGFDTKDTALLLGPSATKAAIEREISSKLLEGVTDEDCVLFYFSGHGYGRPQPHDQTTLGELIPYDSEFHEGAPKLVSSLQMETLVRTLERYSKARHKLLVLDCCHSGAVFSQEGRRSVPFDALRVDQSVFTAPGFQAMTASRELQLASDSARPQDGQNSPHSPFTASLLNTLRQLPAMKGEGAVFTTSQVFVGMQLYLDASLAGKQSPLCSWLDAGQGEFHFQVQKLPPEPDRLDEQIRKNMIAMVPGSFGNWWFDECPWFLPGLRYEIISDSQQSRSVNLEIISVRQLEDAANKMRMRLRNSGRLSENAQRRLNHMELLMVGSGEEWNRNARQIIKELKAQKDEAVEKLARDEDQRPGDFHPVTTGTRAQRIEMDAVDLHFLAVLLHSMRQDVDEAIDCYRRALTAYEDDIQRNPHYKALKAMCLADLGWFYADVQRDFDAASRHFSEARSIYGPMTPQPFMVFVLCRDAESLLHLGREGVAVQRLNDALECVREVDPHEAFPLSAAFYHRRAWLRMQACRFREAAEDFHHSNHILAPMIGENEGQGGASSSGDMEAKILTFHNLHGAALAQKFLGQRDEAVGQYRRLYSQILDEFLRLRQADDRETNYRQTKGRLVERLVNTLERTADCSLFNLPTNATEAADDYRRALVACGYMVPEKRSRLEQRVRYKYALALSIPGTTAYDPELAAEQLRLAADSTKPATEGKSQQEIARGDVGINQPSIHICRDLTRLLLAADLKPDPQGELTCQLEQLAKYAGILRNTLEAYLDEERLNRTLNREDLEAAMFALKILLEDLKEPLAEIKDPLIPTRVARRNDLTTLLGYCRSARRGGYDSLPFSRPYYDCALRGLIALEPKNAKQLIEVSYEAMHAQMYRKSEKPEIMMVVYCLDPVSYVFLDVPGSVSSCFALPQEVNAKFLSEAARGERKLQLPTQVYKELAMAGVEGLPVLACWRDCVTGVGIDQSEQPTQTVLASGSGGEIPKSATPVSTRISDGEAFPFQLPTGLTVRSPEIKANAPGNSSTLARTR
ncbi:caspase family protein [Planctomicrobium sp. SH664]|uniref:caspase family protein n=1 Tax=Planctomicrobium sp. SH664 TaxID=3448125 RepID=UPI003F5BE6B7